MSGLNCLRREPGPRDGYTEHLGGPYQVTFICKCIDMLKCREGYDCIREDILVHQQQGGCQFRHGQQEIDLSLLDHAGQELDEQVRLQPGRWVSEEAARMT